jgi:ClpP class serine protease
MAITRRATEDFCSGVRTEFRRLVDEITESRAFIQRLEKLLGEEIEQKVNMGIEKSEELKEAERQLRLMEQRERSRMLTLASMKRALKDQMQDVREMLDKRKSSAGGTKPTIAVEDVS